MEENPLIPLGFILLLAALIIVILVLVLTLHLLRRGRIARLQDPRRDHIYGNERTKRIN